MKATPLEESMVLHTCTCTCEKKEEEEGPLGPCSCHQAWKTAFRKKSLATRKKRNCEPSLLEEPRVARSFLAHIFVSYPGAATSHLSARQGGRDHPARARLPYIVPPLPPHLAGT